MSAGVVIFILRGEPITTTTGNACALDQRSLVGSEKAVGDGVIEGLFQDVVAKTLRGLRHHHAGARDGGFDECAVGGSFHLFHRVHGGPARDGGSVLCARPRLHCQ